MGFKFIASIKVQIKVENPDQKAKRTTNAAFSTNIIQEANLL